LPFSVPHCLSNKGNGVRPYTVHKCTEGVSVCVDARVIECYEIKYMINE